MLASYLKLMTTATALMRTYFARNVKNAISSEVINFTTHASRAVNLEGKSKVKGVEVALQR